MHLHPGAFMLVPFQAKEIFKQIEAALLAGGVPIEKGIPFDNLDHDIPSFRHRGKCLYHNGLFLVWQANKNKVEAIVQTYPPESVNVDQDDRYPENETLGGAASRKRTDSS